MHAAQEGSEAAAGAAQEETRPSVLLVGNPSLPLKVLHTSLLVTWLSLVTLVANTSKVWLIPSSMHRAYLTSVAVIVSNSLVQRLHCGGCTSAVAPVLMPCHTHCASPLSTGSLAGF